MSNARPYLFGALLGASAMYVALQYHVVHSHDGFQMVPRTPQHSVGLAYADVRNWSASQWTDRPELARALMAHGSSDLISESVANSLADSVTEENSTLDQLRLFLEESAQEGTKSNPAGLLQIPSSTRKPVNSQSGSDDDLTRIPFPQDARNGIVADPFRVAQTPHPSDANIEKPPGSSAGTSRFSSEDVINGLRDNANEPTNAVAAAPSTSASATNASPAGRSVKSGTSQQMQAIEDQIFGSENSSGRSSIPAANAAPASSAGSMFEEVSTQLENRAQAALNRAKETATDKSKSGLNESSESSENYMRKQTDEFAPSDLKAATSTGSLQNATNAPGSLLERFDPFLE